MGQEDAKSVGRLSTGSQHVCGYPSVYLSVQICAHPSICPVFVPILYMCLEEYIIAPEGMDAQSVRHMWNAYTSSVCVEGGGM